jgi:hypothetical protein
LLEEARQKLARKIEAFHQKADTMMENLDFESITIASLVEDDDFSDGDSDGPPNCMNEEVDPPETTALLLPSALDATDIQRLGLSALAKQELELRKGEANDILENLRMALGHKAILFRQEVNYTFPWQDQSLF